MNQAVDALDHIGDTSLCYNPTLTAQKNPSA